MPRDDACRVEPCPELSLLTTGRLEADDRIPFASKVCHGNVTFRSIRDPASKTIRQAMKVEPVAAHVYADDAAI